jgi:hypothetical protein
MKIGFEGVVGTAVAKYKQWNVVHPEMPFVSVPHKTQKAY